MERVRSDSSYAEVIGFSRSVRAGQVIYLAGISAVDADGLVIGGEDAGLQAAECLRKAGEALAQHGASLKDVVHTRMFLKNAGDWPAVGAEHARAFGADRPAATMIVAGLLDPRMLIELEMVAQLED